MSVPDAGTENRATISPSPLGWGLMLLGRQWRNRVRLAAGDLPHGSRGYQVLAEAGAATSSNQSVLAATLGIDRTVMTYVIDSLVEAGLVEREPDPVDRRARRVVLTEPGRAALNRIDAAVADVEADLLGALSNGERRELCTLLERAASGLVHDDKRCAVVATALDGG